MANFIQTTPFMHVPEIGEVIAFFEDVLGFETHARMSDYAYLGRDGVGMRILQNHVDVRDVDALHAGLKPKLDALPLGDVHRPADKPYGQRELVMVAPDGNLIAFGQAIKG